MESFFKALSSEFLSNFSSTFVFLLRSEILVEIVTNDHNEVDLQCVFHWYGVGCFSFASPEIFRISDSSLASLQQQQFQ